MMATEQGSAWQLERVSTGIPNLDLLLGGGLTRGGLTLVVGGPGTGKTVLAEQMAFHWASQGQNVLWLVTLGEPNEKFLAHLSEMRFYDRRQVGATIQLVNLSRFLRRRFEEKLNAIRETVRSDTYRFVIIDGFQNIRGFLRDDQEVRLFLSELGTELGLMGITLIVTTDANPDRYWEDPQFTMVDGIIALSRTAANGRERRRLQILKLRGSDVVEGAHTYPISSEGVYVYPRRETVLGRGQAPQPEERLSTGLPGLDRMLKGGLGEGTSTLVVGPAGVGKSLLASHFLAEGIRQEEPCLAMVFFESPTRLLLRGDAFGLPLCQGRQAGLLQVWHCAPQCCEPDACGEEIWQAVESRGIRRLVIDGIEPIERDLAASERAPAYLSALTGYLRSRGVTSLFTYDLPTLVGPAVTLPRPAIGLVAANLILMRFVATEGRLRRFLSVVETRYSAHSDAVAEVMLSEGRMDVVTELGEPERELAGAFVATRGEA